MIVVDNASEPPAESVVDEVMSASAWPVRVIRNPVNIGLCANLLRCFEVAGAEWLWMLGDDDTVKGTAIATILDTIQKRPELLYATYSVPVTPVHQDLICESVDDFFQVLESVPQVIFISSALYNRRKLIPYLSLAYNFIDSGAPHIALLLLAGLAHRKRQMAYLSQEIVTWQPPPAEQAYSSFSAICQYKLMGLCSEPTRAHLAGLLLQGIPSIFRLFAHVVRDAANHRDRTVLNTILDRYFDAYGRIKGGIAGFFWRGPARLVARFSLRFARETKSVADFASKLLRRKPISYDPAPVSLDSYLRLSELSRENAALR